jgi:hypothetical protein
LTLTPASIGHYANSVAGTIGVYSPESGHNWGCSPGS